MPPLAAAADQSLASLGSVRVHLGDDPVEMQRRLEAFLLIARRVFPTASPSSA